MRVAVGCGASTPILDLDEDQNQNYSINAGMTLAWWQANIAPQHDPYDWNPVTDPCRSTTNGGGPGWRIPSESELQDLRDYNTRLSVGTWEATPSGQFYNYSAGKKVGANLFFPAVCVYMRWKQLGVLRDVPIL